MCVELTIKHYIVIFLFVSCANVFYKWNQIDMKGNCVITIIIKIKKKLEKWKSRNKKTTENSLVTILLKIVVSSSINVKKRNNFDDNYACSFPGSHLHRWAHQIYDSLSGTLPPGLHSAGLRVRRGTAEA